jgi:hypothetical protein
VILQEVIPINFGPYSAESKLFVDPEVTVLTGANDTGKSSMLRLIHYICGDKAADERDYNQDRQGTIPQPWQNDPDFGCVAKFRVEDDSTSWFNHSTHIQNGDVVTVRFRIAPAVKGRQVLEVTRNGIKAGMPNGFILNILPQFRMLPLATEIKDTIDFTNMNEAESSLVKLGFGENFTFEHYRSFRENTRANQVGSAEAKLNRLLDKVLPSAMGLRFHLREIGSKPELLTISLIDRHNGFAPLGSRGTGVRKVLNVMGTLLTIDRK